jgi:hypothetical protein
VWCAPITTGQHLFAFAAPSAAPQLTLFSSIPTSAKPI